MRTGLRFASCVATRGWLIYLFSFSTAYTPEDLIRVRNEDKESVAGVGGCYAALLYPRHTHIPPHVSANLCRSSGHSTTRKQTGDLFAPRVTGKADCWCRFPPFYLENPGHIQESKGSGSSVKGGDHTTDNSVVSQNLKDAPPLKNYVINPLYNPDIRITGGEILGLWNPRQQRSLAWLFVRVDEAWVEKWQWTHSDSLSPRQASSLP